MQTTIINVGCNLDNRLQQLRQAYQLLLQHPDLDITAVSPIYESDAQVTEQAPEEWRQLPYLNVSIAINSALTPEQLLDVTQSIEQQMGRRKSERWAPRGCDIDHLASTVGRYQSDRLTLPHSQLAARPFHLWPLLDCWPEWLEQHDSHINISDWGNRHQAIAPFRTRQIQHRIDTPQIMAIVNITPDSNSDGNCYLETETAIAHAIECFEQGASIIDLGAEATSPFDAKIGVDTPTIKHEIEWQRLQPVLQGLSQHWAKKANKPLISLDTRNPLTLKKALDYPIDILNDVTGLDNLKLREIALAHKLTCIVMHHCTPDTYDQYATSPNILESVYQWGRARLDALQTQGFSAERLIFDVGIGYGDLFGKTAEQSLALLRGIEQFKQLAVPLCVGHSRKSYNSLFIDCHPDQRDIETLPATLWLNDVGVDYLRVHNVRANTQALKVHQALRARC